MSEHFTFEALPARKGDCLILHFGSAGVPHLCVVDGGPGKVYQEALRPRLQQISDARGLGFGESLAVDLLMVSHVDDDHINGVLDLAKELQEARERSEVPLVRVQTLWHNSFDEIIGNSADFSSPEAGVLASMGGGIVPPDGDPHAAMVLASVRQGHALRGSAKVLGWEVNAPYPEIVIDTGPQSARIDRFGGGLQITVLGPHRKQLDKLQKAYDKFLKDKGLGREAPEAALAAISKDRSVANLSSIVALLEKGGKRILLTGDALGDHILDGLEMRGLATPEAPFFVDVLKLQHHGSERNVTPEFFQRVKARHYVFCGNGHHGNPERLTLEWLLAAQGGEAVSLHFTYPLAEIDHERQEEAAKKGKPWDPAQHGLATLLEGARAAGRALDWTEGGVRLDLLDPVPV